MSFQIYDLYTGWIVAFVDGQWRHVRLAAGYATLALWDKPNEHVGIVEQKAAQAAKPGDAVQFWELATSPFALVAGPVLDPNILERIAFVRFGRVEGCNAGLSAIIDSLDTGRRLVGLNYDDTSDIDPDWPRLPPPETPSRWTRSVRSLVIS